LITGRRYTSLSVSETTCDPPATLRVFPDLLTRSVSRSDAGGANRQWYVRLTVRHVTLDFCDPKSAGLFRPTRRHVTLDFCDPKSAGLFRPTLRHVTLDFCDPKSAGLFRPTRRHVTLGFATRKVPDCFALPAPPALISRITKRNQIGTGVFSVSAFEAYTYPLRSGFSTVTAMIAARKSIVIITANTMIQLPVTS
jgi:hypothetical protein